MTITRSRIAAVGAAALIALAALFAAPTAALAHDELVGTEILSDSEGAPEAVQLTFSNSILDAGTEIAVTAPDGSDMAGGEPVLAGPQVIQPLGHDLTAGDYAATWRVVSSDGHPIEGTFVIAIAEDGSAEIRDEALVEDDPRFSETETPASESADASADEAAAGDGAAHPAQIVALVLVGIAAIGAVIAIVVGQRRRAQAIAEAGEGHAR